MLWIEACVFLTVLFLGFTLIQVLSPPQAAIEKRLLRHIPRSGAEIGLEINALRRYSDLPFLDRLIGRTGPLHRFSLWYGQADLPMSFGAFLLTALCLFFLFFTLTFAASGKVIFSLFAAATAGSWPLLMARMKRAKRQALFSAAFPDSIGRLASSLRAGYSMQMSIETIVKDSDNLVSREFRKVLEQMEAGQNFETALEKMIARMDTPELRLFIASIAIQRESGGNLVEVLENLEHTIRERFQLRRELNAATSQARFSGIVLSLLPVLVGLAVFLIHREHMMFLFRDPAGQVIFRVCVVGQILGIFFIRKIVKIDI